MNFVIYIENLAPTGTASQSSVFSSRIGHRQFTADLAVNFGSTETPYDGGCSLTRHNRYQRFAWWMLSFPVDAVYVTNVKIYTKDVSKFS
jgi:hypothetical protein